MGQWDLGTGSHSLAWAHRGLPCATVGVFIAGWFGSCRWTPLHVGTHSTQCVSLLGAQSCPSNLSFTYSSPELGGRQAGVGCPNAWFHQAPMGGPWEQTGAAELVVWCFPIMNGSMLGLWASGSEICPSLQPSCTGDASPGCGAPCPLGKLRHTSRWQGGDSGRAGKPCCPRVEWRQRGRLGWFCCLPTGGCWRQGLTASVTLPQAPSGPSGAATTTRPRRRAREWSGSGRMTAGRGRPTTWTWASPSSAPTRSSTPGWT